MDRADRFFWRFASSIGPAIRNFGESGVGIFKGAKLYRLPEFLVVVYFDSGKVLIRLSQLGEASKYLRNTAMIRFCEQKPGEVLDRRGFASAPRGTPVPNLFLEPITERRRAKAFADLIHKAHDCRG